MSVKRKNFNTEAILKEVYPLIEKAMTLRFNQWKQCLSNFMQKRASSLFDTMPCDRIFFDDKDSQELFNSLMINDDTVKNGMKNTYYWPITEFRPKAAKDSTTIAALCIVRYFFIKKDTKNLDLSLIYLAFTGKFYPSIHKLMFPLVTPAKYRHVMDYVINNKLNNKFEIKATGSVIGAIKSICATWIDSYKEMLTRFEDEDITYIIQQLHNRIKAMLKNLAELYYESYKDKEFISYDKDSLPEEEGSGQFHLTNNDSFRLQQYVENTMTKLNSSQIDYKTCKMCADANVKTEEIRSIFESIFNDKSNLDMVREYITNMIATYMTQAENKDVTTIAFFRFSTAVKPNSKDEAIIRMKDIIETLLDSNSVAYRKRKHRNATRSSYHKAFATYFAISIINANK